MAKKWTPDEDAFLLRWHGIGADFVASHDLGRPDGAGSRRLAKLLKSGAALKFAEMKLSQIEFEFLAGHLSSTGRSGFKYWEDEARAAFAAMEVDKT
jgi:hypothetical protein